MSWRSAATETRRKLLRQVRIIAPARSNPTRAINLNSIIDSRRIRNLGMRQVASQLTTARVGRVLLRNDAKLSESSPAARRGGGGGLCKGDDACAVAAPAALLLPSPLVICGTFGHARAAAQVSASTGEPATASMSAASCWSKCATAPQLRAEARTRRAKAC